MNGNFSIVVAADQNRGIGLKGRLPWKISGDMRFFRDITSCPERTQVESHYGLTGSGVKTAEATVLPMPAPDRRNAVLMGRNTWESLPANFKPLPNRINGVLSRSGGSAVEGTHKVWTSLKDAVAELHRDESIREIFVIGGAQIYAEALTLPGCERIYLTAIEASYPCDAFLPEIPSSFREVAASDPIEENGVRYRFRLLQRDIK